MIAKFNILLAPKRFTYSNAKDWLTEDLTPCL